MTPREIVYRAIEQRNPSRVPIYYFNRDHDCSDILAVSPVSASDFREGRPGEAEWGYVWTTLDDTMGQPQQPPLADWSRISLFQPPDPWAPGRLDHINGTIANEDRFIKCSLGITGFNQATFLRGFEQFLDDLYTNPGHAEQVLDLVFDFENGLIEQLASFAIDAVSFSDDWGTQQGLIVSPDCWRRTFKPRYEAQFARVHAQGKKVWFHTCGKASVIIQDLIEIGVDVLELLQPDVYGVEWLGREYGGNVCFCCSIDHQRHAIAGTRDEIFTYARLLHEALGSANGGFIAYIEDYVSLGMGEQQYQWIRQAFHQLNSI